MFKNLAADAFGLSDLGKIIDPKDFDKTDIDDYIFHEDDEKIYAVIKSKSDEYCFTNVAFIHLDGASAMSKKKTLKRYPYKHYAISNILIETAGTVDLDAELKFVLGNSNYSIDIDKKQIEKIKDIYKALFAISEEFVEISHNMDVLKQTTSSVNSMFDLKQLGDEAVLNLPDIINQTAQQLELHYNNRKHEIKNYDFGPIFNKYLEW